MCVYKRQILHKNILLICRKPDNEFVSESQAEEVTISKSDKRSRAEENLSQNVDATLSVSAKRPKIISSKCVEIIQNRNGIELIEVNNSILNKSQIKENSCEDIISKLNENDRTKEEFQEAKDTDVDCSKISFIERQTCKPLNIIAASKCTGRFPSVMLNVIKPIETDNSIIDVDKSREDENLCEEKEIETILQEQYEVHHNEKENQHNIDKIINTITENKVEGELITHVNIEEKQFKENIESCTNNTCTDKRIEMSPQKYSITEEEIYMEIDEENPENQEESNISIRNSPNRLKDEPDWHS